MFKTVSGEKRLNRYIDKLPKELSRNLMITSIQKVYQFSREVVTGQAIKRLCSDTNDPWR